MSTTRTLADELAWGTKSLEEVGIGTARLDAELLLGHLLKIDRAALVMRSDERITGDARTGYLALVARRAGYEPMSYITGKQAFRHLDLAVDPRALIPRPETELLVEVGLELPAGSRVVDVGTGSGAVALALKQERPDLIVSGLEVSEGALQLARLNAQRLRLDVRFELSDLLDDGDYDAVLANLPYVKDGEILPPDVAWFEPEVALFGGPDGLGLVRTLLEQAAARPGIRLIALEIGYKQGPGTAEIVRAAGFGDVTIRPDLAGHERVVVGQRA
jgi:release factor glutamine methyltransferase